MLIESSPTRWNAAKADQFILHKIPVHLWHNLSELSEAESCLCVFVVDVSKAATLIGNVFLTNVRDLGLEKINARGDVMLQPKEEIFGIYVENKGTTGGGEEWCGRPGRQSKKEGEMVCK